MHDESQNKPSVARYAKGKRPSFYNDPAMDEAMSMIMVLASELSVLRDRLDTYETVMEAKGAVCRSDIEAHAPDDETLNRREEERQALFKRLFFVANKRAAEQASSDTADRYTNVLKTTAAE